MSSYFLYSRTPLKQLMNPAKFRREETMIESQFVEGKYTRFRKYILIYRSILYVLVFGNQSNTFSIKPESTHLHLNILISKTPNICIYTY